MGKSNPWSNCCNSNYLNLFTQLPNDTHCCCQYSIIYFINTLLLHQSNITLNTLTLGGLAVAVGRLVDDSIVVIENIFRRLQKEAFSKDIILDATKEVAVAITSSTLTTVAVFTYWPRIRSNRKINVTYGISSRIFYTIILNRCTNSCSTYGFLLLKNKTQKPSSSPRYVATLKWALSHKFIILLTFFIIRRIDRRLCITTESEYKI